MNVEEMIAKYNLKPRGVIQVGSHHGEEIPVWQQIGVPHVHFEPVKANVDVLLQKYPGVDGFSVALGNADGMKEMFTETVNGGQSCSLLQPKNHLYLLPWIAFTAKEWVRVRRLDDVDLPLGRSQYNFMYVDVQGYELQVFMGGINTLKGIDFIFTEVNKTDVFDGCAKIGELDAFLADQGFMRKETEWHGVEFGDALYVRV